jgi:hypothetical protein
MAAKELALAQLELLRVRKIRAELLDKADLASGDHKQLRRLAALDYDERIAHTKRRRAVSRRHPNWQRRSWSCCKSEAPAPSLWTLDWRLVINCVVWRLWATTNPSPSPSVDGHRAIFEESTILKYQLLCENERTQSQLATGARLASTSLRLVLKKRSHL